MKKPRLYLIKKRNLSESAALDLPQGSATKQRRVSARQGNPRQSDPTRNFFTVNPDIDTPTLLANASQNLASMKVIANGLTVQLDGQHRYVALGIQRLVVVAELLVNQALINVGSPESTA